MRLTLIIAALLLAGCGAASTSAASSTSSSPAPSTASPATTSSASPSPSTDPYLEYLRLNPDKTLVLSRQDAATRALLGCGQAWPPGTIDAVLQQVYAAYCPKG